MKVEESTLILFPPYLYTNVITVIIVTTTTTIRAIKITIIQTNLIQSIQILFEVRIVPTIPRQEQRQSPSVGHFRWPVVAIGHGHWWMGLEGHGLSLDAASIVDALDAVSIG